MDVTLWLVPLIAAVLIVFSLRRGALSLSPTGARDADAASRHANEVPEAERPFPVVVVNPRKFTDPEQVRELIAQECRLLGWREPRFLETTAEDSGISQARQALALDPDVVLAMGGDGTVRLVAQVMAGSGVPMGVLPAGTGNLLAHNLDLPVVDPSAAVRVALTGRTRHIDVGWVSIDGAEETAFLVMAGMGFDGEIMENTPSELKDRAGAGAYLVGAVKNLNGHRTRVRVAVDDHVTHHRIRSVIVGNCGRLQGGIELLPDAVVDDGRLDVMKLSPRGVAGWGAVAVAVLTKRHRGHALVETRQGERVDAWSEQPLTAQVDGDPAGPCIRLRARVDPGALQVRVPAGGAP